MNKSISTLATVAFIGSLIGGVARYLLNIIIGNYFGPEALGLFSVGFVIMSIGGTIGRAGLDNAVQRFVPAKIGEGQVEDARSDIHASIALSGVFGFIAAIIGLCSIYFYNPTGETVGELLFFILSIPLFSIMWVAIKSTVAIKETKYQVYIRDFVQSGTAIIAIFFISVVFGNHILIGVGYFVSLLLGCVVSIYYIAKLFDMRFRRETIRLSRFSYLLKYSLPLLVVAVTQYLISWTDVMMLAVLTSTAQVGVYQAAFQTAAVLSMVLQGINSIFPSVASELYHTSDDSKLFAVFSALTKWGTYITTLGFLIICIFSDQILSVLFGVEFIEGDTALIVLAGGQLMAVAAGPAGYMLSMSDWEKLESFNTVAVALVNVVLNFFLISKYGIIGAAIATAASLALLNVIRSIEIYKIFGIFPINRDYWKGTTAMTFSLIILLFIDWMNLPATISIIIAPLVTTGIFAFVIFTLGIDKADRELLQSV